jgi:calcineurin-like phosphoesterase family protein
MKIYFTSDTHYLHANIIKYCRRPFAGVEEMSIALVKEWNSVVADEDVVFHLGDYALPKLPQLQHLRDMTLSLKGTKFFVRGNHDKVSDDFLLSSGFKSIHKFINLGSVLLVHHPLHEAVERGVLRSEHSRVEHVVHGHIHRSDLPNFDAHYNVAVDRNDFRPVPLEVAVPEALHASFMKDLQKLIA